MAKHTTLKAQQRSGTGRTAVKKLRTQGLVPAVVYAAREENMNLTLDARELRNALSHSSSEHILVELQIADGAQALNKLALIQEVQHHPIRGDILHVDFHAVRADEKIRARIPVIAIGESDGVKNSGGVLELLLHEVEVECLPKDLPDAIRVDVTPLALGDSIHIGGLPLPAGVTARAAADVTVIHIGAPRVEVEPTPADAAAAAAAAAAGPEVIKEKKEEPGEAAKPEGKGDKK